MNKNDRFLLGVILIGIVSWNVMYAVIDKTISIISVIMYMVVICSFITALYLQGMERYRPVEVDQ